MGVFVPQHEELQSNRSYRLALACLAGLIVGVLGVAAGVIVKIATGNAILLVVALILMGLCVLAIWTALFMLVRWARGRQRSEGITTYDALMQVRRQLDVDVRRLLRRA
jgi:cation transporter-like permease